MVPEPTISTLSMFISPPSKVETAERASPVAAVRRGLRRRHHATPERGRREQGRSRDRRRARPEYDALCFEIVDGEKHPMKRLYRIVVGLLPLLAASPIAAEDLPQPSPGEAPNGLEYRLIGPAPGGRVARVAGVPGDPSTYFAATAAGGVWRSVNGGRDWKPVFDDQPVSSIGSVAVAPSDPNVVWVGSGEANIRGNVGEGNGIYRSTDGGDSWSRVWTAEGQIGTIAVHPTDPDVVFAAVLGSPFGPGPERGVYRTTDGGETWQRVLFHDDDTGASDVCFDPANPRILFAGLWQTRRRPWGMTSGGPGSGLYVSRDGGDTWQQLEGNGLPPTPWGKVGVRVAPGDATRVYALIEAEAGGLFRSNDGGATWTLVNPSRGLRQRAWYYTTLTVDPDDADTVWFPQVSMLKTIDGGRSVRVVKGGGWDYHDVWIDPTDPDRLIVASDAGVSLSQDGGESWFRAPMAIGQFYRLSVDTRSPYRVLGSLQDYGTASGPSNSLHGGGILLSDWHPVGGGEAGFVVADPTDPDVVWAGEYQGFISRWNGLTGQAPHVGIYPDDGDGHGAADLRHRFQWTAPIVISRHDPQVVYHAAERLFRTADGGQSWTAISPDLTRDDETKQAWSGGPITGDNTGVEFYDTIFAVAESPLEEGLICAGTDDGLVHVTRDGGGAWTNVTPTGFPEWATVRCIEASRWDADTAYVVVDAHRLDDETPYLYATGDLGRTWRLLTAGLDTEVYLHVVREDSRRRGVLYLGSERGVLVSLDDGASWRSLRLNMPTVAIVDLAVAGDDLVVGTLGRSAWILDDLTAVREWSPEVAAKPVHLFAPLPTVRWRYAGEPYGSRDGAGDNPPKGALITYSLAAESEREATLEILDSDGRLVRRLSSVLQPLHTPPDHPDWDPDSDPEPDLTVTAGLNRAAWDLRYEKARWVPGGRLDTGEPAPGPLALPGDYTVRLTVEGQSVTQPLRVELDPRVNASAADLEAQLEFELEVRDRLSRIADMVATIRALREQLEDRDERLAEDPGVEQLVALGTELVVRLDTIEEAVHSPDAEVDYDLLAGRDGGAKLYSRLSWLVMGADDHDGPPTQGMREVLADVSRELEAQESALDALIAEDVPRLDALASELGVGYIVPPAGTQP
jgi:photosystem II stability/assembly factor-like uncharacterized protein